MLTILEFAHANIASLPFRKVSIMLHFYGMYRLGYVLSILHNSTSEISTLPLGALAEKRWASPTSPAQNTFPKKLHFSRKYAIITHLPPKILLLPAIRKRFSHWCSRSPARSRCSPVRHSRIRLTLRQPKLWICSPLWV